MKPAVILLLFALLLAICLPSFALTLEQAKKAVCGFEGNQSLQVDADITSTFCGESGLYQAWVTVSSDPLLRHTYLIEDGASPLVVNVAYEEYSFLNPDASGSSITEQQGQALAESYADTHYMNYDQTGWSLKVFAGQTGTTYHFYKTLANGAEAFDDCVGVEVNLSTGNIAGYYCRESGYGASAEEAPSLTPSQADAAAKQAYAGLASYTMTAATLLVDSSGHLVYRIGYDVQNNEGWYPDDLPAVLDIDANTGSVITPYIFCSLPPSPTSDQPTRDANTDSMPDLSAPVEESSGFLPEDLSPSVGSGLWAGFFCVAILGPLSFLVLRRRSKS